MSAHAFSQLALAEARAFLREPVTVFFTFFFPLLLLAVIGAALGDSPYVEGGGAFPGLRTIDLFVPSMFGLSAANLGLMALPALFAGYRERGILRRYRVTPLSLATLYIAESVVQFAMLVATSVLLVSAVLPFFDLRFPGSVALLLLAFVVSAVAMLSLGFMLSAVARTGRQAQAAGSAVFFSGLFLSGAMFPHELYPGWLQVVSRLNPMTPMVDVLNRSWAGKPLETYADSYVVLALSVVISIAVARATFRWD